MSDYKALVCINLNGGNDGVNTVIPITPELYQGYHDVRPHLALVGDEIDDVDIVDENGTQLGINAELTGIARFIREGNGTAICNVGPLVEPTDRDNYGQVVRPQGLFNHAMQHRVFHTSISEGGADGLGWGGQIAAALLKQDFERSETYSHNITVFADGEHRAVNIDSEGVPAAGGGLNLNSFNDGRPMETFEFIRESSSAYSNYLEKQYCEQVETITSTDEVVQKAVSETEIDDRINRSTNMGRQFSNVKRVIDSASKYGAKRQVFFVSMGGYDNHSELKAAHKRRFNELGEALSEFLAALEADGMLDNVVSFTTSEFGRRVRGNATGSDHGWGSHALVFGGAVKAGKAVGKMPNYDLEASNMISGQDRLIPDISHEQYGATLAKWMGVEDETIQEIFPQSAKHFELDLGFLK